MTDGINPEADISVDSLFSGRLICRQPLKGYRFSVDAVLLAHFFTPDPSENILDLGTGCGVIPLILAYRWPELRLTGLEIQPRLAGLARSNVEANGFAGRISILEGDLRETAELIEPASFRRIVCNPPYGKAGNGRLSPDPELAMARQEVMVDLDAVTEAIGRLLEPDGICDLVFAANRLDELLASLRSNGLEPKRVQPVHGYPGRPARLALVEAVKGVSEGLESLAPFFICARERGEYSPEMARCYEP